MINKEIQDYIDYLLFLKYDRQLVMLAIMYKERDYRLGCSQYV